MGGVLDDEANSESESEPVSEPVSESESNERERAARTARASAAGAGIAGAGADMVSRWRVAALRFSAGKQIRLARRVRECDDRVTA